MPPEVEELDLSRSAFRVGEWVVQPSLNRLVRGETTIQLELKVMDVLVCLAGRAGEVVSRRELTDRVWATEFISDNTVSHAVAELRAALGDDARQPTYIETIHRRGYRLIAAVETVAPEDAGRSKVARFPSIGGAAEPEGERSPYPGLAAFTEEDAEIFFGREAEVARMWRKLTSRRLLAVIGPSGVGKSSFLRAGVIPACPERWSAIVCQPGEGPFGSLARALVPEFVGDIEATAQLVDFRDSDRAVAVVSRWRGRHGQALLVVDQFEELFTQNPPEVQAGFAGFLRKLVDDADVHVVLAMRDDFLYRCQSLESMRPVFDGLLPLEQPDSEPLRRALVEPARRRGYAFEDDELAAEMVAEVAGERGALPMLAFAVARLWERRDRERRLLTRQAYAEIGKVGGALAKHAEATLTALGDERLPIVRELFRNLVTAEGTRAVREWHELLSIFPDSRSESGAAVLRSLIDARLLTSYELREEDRAPTRRVEVVHETLLTSWPRLVRWQTQDADAAQLRDQLRQAARTWDEHERTADYLWSGKAYREFAVWRESYPGGLTELEEEFASAMTTNARRRTRRRRAVVAAAFLVLLAGLTVVGASRQRAIAEAKRAEAAMLLALAQVQLHLSPTEALAYATASVELADNEPARRLALDALAAGPPATLLVVGPPADQFDYAHDVRFSPDGGWAALVGYNGIRVVSRDGAVNRSLEPLPKNEAFAILGAFDRQGGRVLGFRWNGELRIWSVPGFQLLGVHSLPRSAGIPVLVRGDLYVVSSFEDEEEVVVTMPSARGEVRVIGRMKETADPLIGDEGFRYAIDPDGRWLAFARGRELFVRSLQDWSLPPRRIGSHKAPVVNVGFAGDRVSAELESGELWLWSVETEQEPLGPFPIRERGRYFFDDGGARLGVYRSQSDFAVEVWDLRTRERGPAPRYRFPASVFAGGASSFFNGAAFVPGRDLLATAHVAAVAFWPLDRRQPKLLVEGVPTGTGIGVRDLEFTPDGRKLLALVQVGGFGEGAEIWVWDLENGVSRQTLASVSWIQFPKLAVEPHGRFVAVNTWDAIELVPLEAGPVRRLEGFSPGTWIGDIAIAADGRRVAACTWRGSSDDKVIRIWDLETDEVTVLGPGDGAGDEFDGAVTGLGFLPDGSLMSSGFDSGLQLWNFGKESPEVVRSQVSGPLEVLGDGRRIATLVVRDQATNVIEITDLETSVAEILPSRVRKPSCIATDPKGTVLVSAAFQDDGALQVSSVSGSEPHLLPGHERGVRDVAVSPDGEWIASAGQEGTLRLWPMPDLSKPPLHTLPHDELLAKLKSLTNLRAVRDPESATGWKIEVGPFPGWAEVPEW